MSNKRLFGRMIAIIGTDGSGKSTVLSNVIPKIEALTGKQVIVHHLKPNFLPPLGRLRGVKHTAGYVCTTPHGAPPSGFLGSLFRITYLSFDYILGYWLRIRPTLRRKDVACWIFDRYAYDMLIDPLRFRIKLPQCIVRGFLKIIPRPDIVLCLGGSPETIFFRKPETSLIEVRRQMCELRKLVKRTKKACMIDATVPLDETITNVINALKDVWD